MSSALHVLEYVSRHQPVGVSDIARGLGLPKSTVQRMLRELELGEWLEQDLDGSRRWVQTVKMLTLANHDGNRGLRRRAQPVMRALAERCDENVHLAVRSGLNSVIIEKLESSKTVRPFDPLGVLAPLHTTSTGMAMLAWSSDEDVDRYLADGLPSFPDIAPVDPEDVRAELREIRRCGYALNRGLWRPEIHAAAAVLLDDESRPVAAISVAVPAHRLPDAELPALGELVAATVAPLNRFDPAPGGRGRRG